MCVSRGQGLKGLIDPSTAGSGFDLNQVSNSYAGWKYDGGPSLADRTHIVMIAAFCALRPGEIFGLLWSSWKGDHFQIEGTAWRGTLRHGKAKTRGSKAPVTVSDAIIPLLQVWHEQNAAAGPEDLIFPSEKGTPIRPENWLRRRVKPIARALKIRVPVNFQVFRRTFATNAQGMGNPKDVQTHLRHKSAATINPSRVGIITTNVPLNCSG